MGAPLNLFYSYSKSDEKYLNALKRHLSRLVQLGLIRDWSDQNISPATEWQPDIDNRLRSAHIVLFLLSADFIASDFCMGKELPFVLDRYDRGETVRILPVIVRACAWKDLELQKFQVLPSREKNQFKTTNREIVPINVSTIR